MPSKSSSPAFVDAVKPALESLLSDLQRTTEVLRRANDKSQWELEEGAAGNGTTRTTTRTTVTTNYGGGGGKGRDDDIEPIYQEQNLSASGRNPQHPSAGGADHHGRHSATKSDSRAKPSELDSMLGSLQVDMDKHGIHTIPKGDCASCGKSIVGQVVIALGKMWHPEHYVCCHCGDEIGHRNFFERGGKAYCESDYHDLFSPRCAYCNGPIKERCVTALGKTFHPEHFCCAECGRPFGDDGFHEKDGYAYCKDDFYAIYAPKCQGCRKTIQHKFITALGTHWHPDCFICQECRVPFGAGVAFFEHNGLPLCEQHYHEKRGSLCSQCRAPISGRCVSALGRKFHPQCFNCGYCARQLCRGTFKELRGKAFCQKCYEKCTNGV